MRPEPDALGDPGGPDRHVLEPLMPDRWKTATDRLAGLVSDRDLLELVQLALAVYGPWRVAVALVSVEDPEDLEDAEEPESLGDGRGSLSRSLVHPIVQRL